jgi:hypothetical protein
MGKYASVAGGNGDTNPPTAYLATLGNRYLLQDLSFYRFHCTNF